jgi:hypothetical protein
MGRINLEMDIRHCNISALEALRCELARNWGFFLRLGEISSIKHLSGKIIAPVLPLQECDVRSPKVPTSIRSPEARSRTQLLQLRQ